MGKHKKIISGGLWNAAVLIAAHDGMGHHVDGDDMGLTGVQC